MYMYIPISGGTELYSIIEMHVLDYECLYVTKHYDKMSIFFSFFFFTYACELILNIVIKMILILQLQLFHHL